MRSAAAGIIFLLPVCVAGLSPVASSQHQPAKSVRVAVVPTLKALIRDEDTDNDRRITVDDPRPRGSHRGDRRFTLQTPDGHSFAVQGTYPLANLLAALKLAEEEGRDSLDLGYDGLFAPPVEQITRSIRDRYWRALTRTLDEKGLAQMLGDEKIQTADPLRYVYVPHDDPAAAEYFRDVARRHPEWNMRIVSLPEAVTPAFVRGLEGRHGVLTLGLRKDSSGVVAGVPFVVPGGRFNEMYGWDSYFIVLGLLHDGHVELARAMVDNLVYEIRHYGKILNANRTYYLTRSQPPFLTSMARAVYERLGRSGENRDWLREVVGAAIAEYEHVWMGPDRLTETGLSRYFDSGVGPPPEVEKGRFDSLFAREARLHQMSAAAFRDAYEKGEVRSIRLDDFFRHDRAMRESGHDASYRLLDRCADLVTVDLNALLYRMELDIAELIEREFGGSIRLDAKVQQSGAWRFRAQNRRESVNRFLWNEKRGMFFDYDLAARRQTEFESATTFYPLWAGLASEAQASRVVTSAVPLLAMPGGIVGSTARSRGPITSGRTQTQWDYPYGWAPHQMLVWAGLQRYRQHSLARELASRWLYTITSVACDYSGTIAEKYDVIERSAQVSAEYGNVGTTFSYLAREGFGWTNASIVVARDLLSPGELEGVNRLVPPEWQRMRASGGEAGK